MMHHHHPHYQHHRCRSRALGVIVGRQTTRSSCSSSARILVSSSLIMEPSKREWRSLYLFRFKDEHCRGGHAIRDANAASGDGEYGGRGDGHAHASSSCGFLIHPRRNFRR